MGLSFEFIKVLESENVVLPASTIPQNETQTWVVYDDVMSALFNMCFQHHSFGDLFTALKHYFMKKLSRFNTGQCQRYVVLFDIAKWVNPRKYRPTGKRTGPPFKNINPYSEEDIKKMVATKISFWGEVDVRRVMNQRSHKQFLFDYLSYRINNDKELNMLHVQADFPLHKTDSSFPHVGEAELRAIYYAKQLYHEDVKTQCLILSKDSDLLVATLTAMSPLECKNTWLELTRKRNKVKRDLVISVPQLYSFAEKQFGTIQAFALSMLAGGTDYVDHINWLPQSALSRASKTCFGPSSKVVRATKGLPSQKKTLTCEDVLEFLQTTFSIHFNSLEVKSWPEIQTKMKNSKITFLEEETRWKWADAVRDNYEYWTSLLVPDQPKKKEKEIEQKVAVQKPKSHISPKRKASHPLLEQLEPRKVWSAWTRSDELEEREKSC